MNNVLNTLQSDLLFDIESNVRSKLNAIVKELKIGKTDSLQKMSYIICGDPTTMKVYEIESYLINDELSSLKPSQLSLLWLATDDGVGYDDSDLNELPYDAYDVFNYVYNNIDMYDSYNYSENDFLELLDRQCWLQTTLKECEISYRKLHDEVISTVEYDDFNALIPKFVDALEDIQFYYIYGNGVDSLSFKEYERHLLYKLANLIGKEKIDKSFFIELTGSYEGFNHFLDNYEFYSLLPPIYFALKIMKTEEFRYPLDFHIDKEIEFISLYSKTIENMAAENDEKFSAFTDKILNTTIFDISNYGSEEYNRLVYNNSDQRYDHDLSRFLQYTNTLKNSKEESTRLWVYTSLKKELEDEYNTIHSSIKGFIDKEFPEFGNKKSTINAVKPLSTLVNQRDISYVNAVKPYIPFPDQVSTRVKQRNKSYEDNKIEKSNSKNKNKEQIRIELFSILLKYVSIDKESFSFLANLKSLFRDNTDNYLKRYHQLSGLEEKLANLIDRILLEGDPAYDVIYEYVDDLKKSIKQLSTIQHKLYQKSNGIEYSKNDYNQDYKLYLNYQNLYIARSTKVNDFFKLNYDDRKVVGVPLSEIEKLDSKTITKGITDKSEVNNDSISLNNIHRKMNKQDCSQKKNNIWKGWWRWILVPFAGIGAGLLVYLIFILIQWLNAYMFGVGFLDQWTFVYILPVIAKVVFGMAYGYVSYLTAPRGKLIVGVIMTILLAVFASVDTYLVLNDISFMIQTKIVIVISAIAMIISSIYGVNAANKD